MMYELLSFDKWLQVLINQQWSNPLLDAVMPIWRDKMTWVPLYVVFVTYLIYRFRWESLWLIIFGAAAVGVADTMSSKIIKPMVQRARPCRDGTMADHTRSLVDCGSGFSFPSSHAANHFALAMWLWVAFNRHRKRWWLWLFVWAGSIAYAQVYVGVHFPIDVLAGGLLGCFVGGLFAMLMRLLYAKWHGVNGVW